jgi:hypothetical protein
VVEQIGAQPNLTDQQGHGEAYEGVGVLHRDISVGNFMISEDGGWSPDGRKLRMIYFISAILAYHGIPEGVAIRF